MCGFLLAPDHLASKIPAGLNRMSHRGADGFQGIVSRGGWTLGHVRLAIQSSEDWGHQPFTREDRSLAFVGEVFARDLEPLIKGDEWTLEEDVLFDALRSPNLSGLMRLDGFWSLAEIREDGKARVITDHLGIKPVFYWPDYDIFCSELEPMFELQPRPPLDETYLSNCIKFGYDYSGRTPYRGIVQVAPGTAMVRDTLLWSGHSFRPFPYWDWAKVPGADNTPTDAMLRHHLTKATKWRAGASFRREIALLLSGGLDSTIIYSILNSSGLLSDQVSVYSIENGESQFLPAGVNFLEVDGTSIEEGLDHIQAPLDLGSLLPQVQLAKALGQQGIRVCLTGDGADEIFGGYRRAQEYDSQASDVFCELPYYHLPRLDRVHMRQTTEVRSPFLAPSVVALGLRLPYADRTSKQALKRAFSHLVPKRILEREKHPLKGPRYLENPLNYRAQLVETFRNA